MTLVDSRAHHYFTSESRMIKIKAGKNILLKAGKSSSPPKDPLFLAFVPFALEAIRALISSGVRDKAPAV